MQDPIKFGVGQPVPRSEDPRLLTGGGRYTDDVSAPGQAHARFVRSTLAHGRIRSIDVSAAMAAPGVLAVITGSELAEAGIGTMPCAAPLKSRDGSPLIVPPKRPMATDRVRYVGEPIAIVVAETDAAARDAIELVQMEIDPLPAIVRPDDAMRIGAPQVWDEAPGNVCLDFFVGDAEATDAAFARAAHVTRLTLENTRMVVNAMEPRAALAQFDATSGRFTLHTPSQGVAGFRGAMARLLGVKPPRMRVISGDVGGSFGMKGMAYCEPAAALFAARTLNRPVKWCADRSESFLSDHHGRASMLTVELALDRDGTFLGLRVSGWGDVGAYLTTMGPLPATAVISRNIVSVYRIPVMAYAVKVVFTNTVPTGPYRGAGRPESKYVLETLIDRAARETGIDRVEIRRRNLIPPDAMPYRTPNGNVYDSGEFEALMDEALKRADWAGFAARKKESASRERLRGISVTPYLENTAASGTELADIRFEADGTVTLIAGTRDIGTGHATPWAQVLADRLGIPFAAIRLREDDSDLMSEGAGGSGGSRSAIAASGAILECSDRVEEQGRAAAAFILETAIEDIAFEHGLFRIAGTDRSIEIMALAKALRDRSDLSAGVPKSLNARVNHTTAPSSWPNGCHVCELEVDPETGVVEILRYTVVDDFGVVINPPIVAGQVHGGIAQGVGQILLERTVYDDDGQLLTGSYMDYAMPRADDLPSFCFATRNVPCTTNPLGLKGCGEAGNGGSMPAVMNAILDALAEVGVTHLEAPATPHRIWQAIRETDRP
jgi:carbon-monoxide dehydrogenase large subunit